MNRNNATKDIDFKTFIESMRNINTLGKEADRITYLSTPMGDTENSIYNSLRNQYLQEWEPKITYEQAKENYKNEYINEYIEDMIEKYLPKKNEFYQRLNTKYENLLKSIIIEYSNVNCFERTQYSSDVIKSYSKYLLEETIKNFFIGNYFRKYQKSIHIGVSILGFNDESRSSDNFLIEISNEEYKIKIVSSINCLEKFLLSKTLGDFKTGFSSVNSIKIVSELKQSKIVLNATREDGFNSFSNKKINQYLTNFSEPDEIVEIRNREKISELEKLTSIIKSNSILICSLLKLYLNGNELRTMLSLNQKVLDLVLQFGTQEKYKNELYSSIENIEMIRNIIRERKDIQI